MIRCVAVLVECGYAFPMRSLSLLAVLLTAPSTALAAGPPALDLDWRPVDSMTADERTVLREQPAFVAGEALFAGGLVAAGVGIGMLVAGLATDSKPLTAAGAVTWPVGATAHFVGLGLWTSRARAYYRERESR